MEKIVKFSMMNNNSQFINKLKRIKSKWNANKTYRF